MIVVTTRPGVDKVKPKVWLKYSLSLLIDYKEHGRPAFGPSCTEFVYPECWHFDIAAKSKIDDILTELGGLLHVLPLAVNLSFFAGQVGGTILNLSYSLNFLVGPLLRA